MRVTAGRIYSAQKNEIAVVNAPDGEKVKCGPWALRIHAHPARQQQAAPAVGGTPLRRNCLVLFGHEPCWIAGDGGWGFRAQGFLRLGEAWVRHVRNPVSRRRNGEVNRRDAFARLALATA